MSAPADVVVDRTVVVADVVVDRTVAVAVVDNPDEDSIHVADSVAENMAENVPHHYAVAVAAAAAVVVVIEVILPWQFSVTILAVEYAAAAAIQLAAVLDSAVVPAVGIQRAVVVDFVVQFEAVELMNSVADVVADDSVDSVVQ